MKTLTLALIGLLTVTTTAQADENDPVTIQLFNGRNLDGLHVYLADESIEASKAWAVEEGMLRCTGTSKGYVRTDMPYADYKLSLEWRWPDGQGNSGVMVHVVNPDILWPKCFEAQLRSSRAGDFASFSDARSQEEIVSRNPRGVSTGRLSRPVPSTEKPVGEWNKYEILAQGDTITLFVNGTEVNRMTGVVPSAGMIALQAEGTAIDFRNIELTLLPPAKDLHAPMPK